MTGKFKKKPNKLKIKKLQINLTNRWLYTLIVFFSLIAIGVGVYAAVGTTPNPGHPITALQPCNTAGEILKSDGTTWTCGTDDGGTGLWNPYSLGIYYDGGDVSIYDNTNPTLNFGDAYGNSLIAGVQLHVTDEFLDIGDYMAETTEIGVRFFTNDAERMRIDKDGNVIIYNDVYADSFTGDGSGLNNIMVMVTEAGETCDSTTDGTLKYSSDACAADDFKNSILEICMKQGGSDYDWYVIKTSSIWLDADACDTDGCPPGENYYQCRYIAPPGCYAYEPYDCYFPRPCFLAGTEILMADGTYKNIEQVEEGELVVSYDTENNLKIISKVADSLVHENVEGYVIINGELEVTSNHPMWIVNRQEWAQVRTIELGDILLDSNGQEIIVISLEDINGVNTVYNFELEGEHKNYFAGDILVHNKIPNGDWLR